MIRIPFYQVDAFADAVFRGNPAAVCVFSDWPPDGTLQSIAAENNLSETAFVLDGEDPVPLRWFTPRAEVPLCGHATLAAGYVYLERVAPGRDAVTFLSRSGRLTVVRDREADGFALDFPALELERVCTPPDALRTGLDPEPVEVLVNHEDPNYFVVLEDEARLAALRPRLATLEELHPYGVAVTAPGRSTDFVSRYFAPSYGIPEDPVTGSIHCALAPYWADRLGRSSLEAIQLSARRGRLGITLRDDRVRLVGRAALYLTGEVLLPDRA